MKIIGHDSWDKSVLVMCSCSSELIWIVKDNDSTYKYKIFYFGGNYSDFIKGYDSCGFSFDSDESFSEFVNSIELCLNCQCEKIVSNFKDGEYMDKKLECSSPELEVMCDGYEKDWITITRIMYSKKNKGKVPVWEILLDEKRAQELVTELKSWIDNEV